jgi:hypothetical protein
MEAVPAATLVVGQTALPFGVLVELLDHPPRVRELDQPFERRCVGQRGIEPLRIALVAGSRPLGQKPRLRAGADATVPDAATERSPP